MTSMFEYLADHGFDPRYYDYPSTTAPIRRLAKQLCQRIRTDLKDRPLCAVTHSLGGIVLRHMRDPRLRWKRIVMLAPPNNGSAVAAALNATNGLIGVAFQVAYGPAGAGLAGATTGAAPRWPFPPAPFAVIAGTRRRSLMNPTSWFVSDRVFADDVEHDGTVSVDETRLPGMAAFRTVDATHTTIADDPEVHRLTVAFLRSGVFTAAPPPTLLHDRDLEDGPEHAVESNARLVGDGVHGDA